MGVDASAIARVLGIQTSFRPAAAGNVFFLPQRVCILGQGATATTYATTKRQIFSANDAGTIYGFGSPIHLAALELMPLNGDGVGTIPVTVYPLVDDPAAVVAQGDITPSGTPATLGTYRIRVSGILGNAFTIAAGAVTGNALNNALRAIGKSIAAVLNMPVNVTYTYGSVTSAPGTNTGNETCTALSVTGTPVPGQWTMKCTAAVTNGGVWSLTDPDGNVVATGLTQTVGVGQATVFNTNGIQFTITDGTTDSAVNDSFTITVPATKVNTPAKWKGASGNKIKLELVGDSFVTFTFTQPTGGATNPSVVSALGQIGNVWETMFLDCMESTDTTTLDAIQTVNEGRWGVLVHKPFVSFCGNTDSSETTAVTVPNARTTDRTNVQLVAPGSPNLPFVVAARQLARIAVVANNNPPTDYGAQTMSDLVPGDDSVQWDYATRDAAVKAGSSTSVVSDGVVTLGDVVTYYHPTGDPLPAYRYVVDIVRLQNIIYNLHLIFATPAWAAAPLVPDAQAVTNPNARRPKDAKAAVGAMLDGLGLQAIISDPSTSKKNTTAAIDGTNPKRLNMTVPVSLSGNTNIKSIDLQFGFFFPAAA
jgi:phage tail sheath gpL-like